MSMKTEDKTRTVETLAKLLSLAERAGTESESQVAFAKAQAFMLKHNISESDIKAEEIKEVVISSSRKSFDVYSMVIVDFMEKHYPMQMLCTKRSYTNNGVTDYIISVVAKASDLSQLYETYKSLSNKIRALAYDKYARHNDWSNITTNVYTRNRPNRVSRAIYLQSFCTGYCDALDEILNRNEREYGLVTTTPKEVVDNVDEKTNGNRVSVNNKVNTDALSEGYKTGLNHTETKELE